MKNKLQRILKISVSVLLAAIIGLFASACGKTGETLSQSSENISSTPSEESSSTPSSETVSSEEAEPEPEPESEPEISLSVTNPTKTDITVNTPKFTFRGSGDPAHPFIFNGEDIPLDEEGLFSVTVPLEEGANSFKLVHKDKTLNYTVRYKKIIIKSVYPSSAVTVESGDKLTVSVVALKDSTVTATFNSKKARLYPVDSDEEDPLSEYATYVGSVETPVNTENLKSYGNIRFSVTSPSGTASVSSGTVKVRTFDISRYDGGNGYPADSIYKNVGKTLVAEVICDSAETFSGNDTADTSRPTNNYLPKGTVDYCSPYTRQYYTGTQTVTLHTLRYGNQLYEKTKNSGTNIKVYEGTLPDTNTVALSSVTQEGHHTLMTFDVGWKAPFRFDLLPQSYLSSGKDNVNYKVNAVTFEYVEIVFCYADSLSFDLDLSSHPVFSRYELETRSYDSVLRLYLKEKGKFYGWSAVYNDAGQLEFRFLCPVTLSVAENEYGYSLDGVTVLIDAGHGGRDQGAAGFVSGVNESQLNLKLALELKKQLKALGATVIMTRSDNSYIEVVDRMSAVQQGRPDYAISIHRNAASASSPNGFISYYFNPFSASAAEDIYEATSAADIYNASIWEGVKWHYFFLCRNTECPVVLTENGFITNRVDYGIMTDKNEECAKALTDGIMKYFINNMPT